MTKLCVRDKVVCVCDKVVCDKAVCDTNGVCVCERWLQTCVCVEWVCVCVTTLCVKDGV